MKPSLLAILRSPGGKGPLRLEANQSQSAGEITSGFLVDDEGRRHPIENGIPNFLTPSLDEGTSYAATDDPRARWKSIIRRYPKLTRIAQWIFDPAYVDHSVRNKLLASLPASARVLNLGSGVFDVKNADCVNLDLEAYGNVDIVADGQSMPFGDASFDMVLLEYVVEHVPDSSQMRMEIERVLKPGGIIYATVPFMQAYHGNPDDYYRFTVSGFKHFWSTSYECLRCEPFGGPTSALVCMIKEWLAIALSFNSRIVYGVLSQLLIIPFFPLKYLDLILRTKNAHNIAFSIYYVGMKPGAPCVAQVDFR